jgi:flagellar protein FliS
MSKNAYSAKYLEAEVASRPVEWLVPLLYEHLLANLHRAAVQIERRDIEGKASSLEKASAILFELLGSLDFDKGGELAQRLAALYQYFAAELLTVGRTLDAAHLRRLTGMIAGLHEAWVQAAEAVRPRAGAASGAAQARIGTPLA